MGEERREKGEKSMSEWVVKSEGEMERKRLKRGWKQRWKSIFHRKSKTTLPKVVKLVLQRMW